MPTINPATKAIKPATAPRDFGSFVDAVRPVCILTSGPLSHRGLASLYRSLSGAGIPRGLLRYDALNSGLTPTEQQHWRSKLDCVGLDLNFPPPTGSIASNGQSSTAGMYHARQAVQQHTLSLSEEFILLWLDADLHFSQLTGTDSGTEEQPDDGGWLYAIWQFSLHNREVDIATGDVIGDPPVPASSTLRSSLVDLVAHYAVADYKAKPLPPQDIHRWCERDPAYDLSERRDSQPPKPQALLMEGPDAYCPTQVANNLLWTGTIARPLVYHQQTAYSPHRPLWVRGGVTVIFNPAKVMHLGYIRLGAADILARRGDSFWMQKGLRNCGWKGGHFPHPLLHRRGIFAGSEDDLAASFVARGVADFVGAAALKAAAHFSEHRTSARLGGCLIRHLNHRREKMLHTLGDSLLLARELRSLSSLPDLPLVEKATQALFEKIAALKPSAISAELLPQINRYFEWED